MVSRPVSSGGAVGAPWSPLGLGTSSASRPRVEGLGPTGEPLPGASSRSATLALLALGGLVLVVWPMPAYEGAGFGPSLLGVASLALWVTARVTARLGPWRGALAGWLLGALVPSLASLAPAALEWLDGKTPHLVLKARAFPSGAWVPSFFLPALTFGAAFFVVQLAPRSAAAWRRLFVAGVPLGGWLLATGGPTGGQEPHLAVAALVAVVGCLRGVEHSSDVLRPFARLAQRAAGLEPREPERS